MSLEIEIQTARKEIVSDGYEMSVGELINLYRDEEIIINPDFQRLFRWDSIRKTRFIESLLLGIPIPPIFVYQGEANVWEVIDGLQRLSTIFEFAGLLRLPDGGLADPSVLEGTRFLPSLADATWKSSPGSTNAIGQAQQIQIKRARIRVEILKQESDPLAKYELFQRLNTGGAALSEQEVRNCVAVMLNKPFYDWLKTCSKNADFRETIQQTSSALKRQAASELALRFFSFRNVPYQKGLDVNEYLDEALMKMASDQEIELDREKDALDRTFGLLRRTMGKRAFKRWDGVSFKGKFLMSVFEVVAFGVSQNLDDIEAKSSHEQKAFVESRCKELWANPVFQKNSGAGVRGTTRLANLLPLAKDHFRA